MEHKDNSTTIQELKDRVVTFREERGWGKHHTPKNLAMSIAIEAAELMEHFQWDDYSLQNKQEIQDELADIFTYVLNMAETCDIDLSAAFQQKLDKVAKKYPVETFQPGKDSPETYRKIKRSHRKNKLK